MECQVVIVRERRGRQAEREERIEYETRQRDASDMAAWRVGEVAS